MRETQTNNTQVDEEAIITVLDVPMIVESFETTENNKQQTISFKEPLHLTVQNQYYKEDNSNVLFIEYDPLGINVYGKDWDDLQKTLQEDLSFLWSWIVICDDNQLSPDAQQVKQNFLNAVIL